jgi:hypothetical protein
MGGVGNRRKNPGEAMAEEQPNQGVSIPSPQGFGEEASVLRPSLGL